jgi:transcriptional regulator with XRE-family HTH domain
MSALDPRQVARAFGAILKAVRAEAGISQEVLAERADCDRTYPSLLERGLRQPTISVLIDIANALRVEPATLVAAFANGVRRREHVDGPAIRSLRSSESGRPWLAAQDNSVTQLGTMHDTWASTPLNLLCG